MEEFTFQSVFSVHMCRDGIFNGCVLLYLDLQYKARLSVRYFLAQNCRFLLLLKMVTVGCRGSKNFHRSMKNFQFYSFNNKEQNSL